MKSRLLGMLLLVSVAVAAQQARDGEAPESAAPLPAAPAQEGDTAESQEAPETAPEGPGEVGSEELDFDPNEEISEDFPVPLPADI